MNSLVSEEKKENPGIHFKMEPALRDEMLKVFDAQGLSLRQGITRLVTFLVTQDRDVWPILLQQSSGEAARAASKKLLASILDGTASMLINSNPSPSQLGNAAFPTGATGTIPRPAGRDVNEAELSPHKKLKAKK